MRTQTDLLGLFFFFKKGSKYIQHLSATARHLCVSKVSKVCEIVPSKLH